MKFLILVVLFASMNVMAQTPTPSAPLQSGTCIANNPNIDEALFRKFFDKMQTAATKTDKKALGNLVLFPLRINGKEKREIKNAAELKSVNVFTPKLMKVLSMQRIEELMCNDQGIMLGSGEAWVKQEKKKIGIFAINETLTKSRWELYKEKPTPKKK